MLRKFYLGRGIQRLWHLSGSKGKWANGARVSKSKMNKCQSSRGGHDQAHLKKSEEDSSVRAEWWWVGESGKIWGQSVRRDQDDIGPYRSLWDTESLWVEKWHDMVWVLSRPFSCCDSNGWEKGQGQGKRDQSREIYCRNPGERSWWHGSCKSFNFWSLSGPRPVVREEIQLRSWGQKKFYPTATVGISWNTHPLDGIEAKSWVSLS